MTLAAHIPSGFTLSRCGDPRWTGAPSLQGWAGLTACLGLPPAPGTSGTPSSRAQTLRAVLAGTRPLAPAPRPRGLALLVTLPGRPGARQAPPASSRAPCFHQDLAGRSGDKTVSLALCFFSAVASGAPRERRGEGEGDGNQKVPDNSSQRLPPSSLTAGWGHVDFCLRAERPLIPASSSEGRPAQHRLPDCPSASGQRLEKCLEERPAFLS